MPTSSSSPESKAALEAYNDPQLQAESLLLSVLPRESYLALCSKGECEIEGKIHSYSLSRTRKTIVTSKSIKDQRWSACIVFSEGDKPLQDRLVMEYLLIRSDEKRYLKTAILTPLMPAALHWDPNAGLPEQYRRGNMIRVRMPPAYRPPRGIQAQDITDNALFRITRRPELQGRRWLLLPDTEFRAQRHRLHPPLMRRMDFTALDMMQPIDDFMARFTVGEAEALAHELVRNPQLNSVIELPLWQGFDMAARTRCNDTNLSVRYLRGFDITQNLFLSELAIGAIGPDIIP